jgi:hypothetical protein
MRHARPHQGFGTNLFGQKLSAMPFSED